MLKKQNERASGRQYGESVYIVERGVSSIGGTIVKLTGQALANKYAEVYAQYVSRESGVPARKCNIWATYIGGGWIEICGSGVPAQRDMQAQYPNGWTLLDKKRSRYVREYIDNQTEVEV